MQSDRDASRANRNWSNRKTTQKPNDASHPYVPLRGFWLSRRGLFYRWLLQSVANCCKLLQPSGSRLKLLQTVTNGCNLLQIQELQNSASRCAPTIALVGEGANRNRWTRIHHPLQKASSDPIYLRSLFSI